MVVITKNERHVNKKILVSVLFLGLAFIIAPLIPFFFNPILTVINYRLRLANGSLLHEIMLQEIEGPQLSYYLFNITNAERFLSGDDAVLKVEEIGPFVYQEYRTFEDLEFNPESNTMQFTPKHRIELVVEESIGRPENFFLVLPNVALLSSIHMLSKYPYFIGQIFKVLISNMNMKALSRVNAYDYMWGKKEPLIALVNSVVPGLIYYKSTGLLARFYDVDANYRLTVDTSDLNKFQVKTVKRFPIENKMNSKTLVEKTLSYNNTYEGAVFPSRLTPQIPVHVYRYSVCNTLRMHYNGTKQMEYGSEAFVYNFDNTTFNERKLCNTKKLCPGGIKDLSMCYYGFPLAISKGHFLDAEPQLFEKIEGLKPNRSLHDSKIVVDPNIGVTVEASMTVQLNLALGEMSLLKEASRLSDMIIPVTRTVLKHPRMREEAKSIFRLMYTTGPYMVISGQILCALCGVLLLLYSAKMMSWHRGGSTTTDLSNKCSLVSRTPLLQ